ncbi:HemK family protein methyltransferase [Streptomyces sp. NPDC005125]
MPLPSQPHVPAELQEGSGGSTPGAKATHPSHLAYEKDILAIWGEVLGRSDIDVSDDFLTLGDHSLAPTVVARIRKTLGVDIPVMDFFESRTVTALAAAVAAKAVAARSSSESRAITRRPADAEPVLSFDQQRLWVENQLLPGVIYNVHMRRRLVGPLDAAVLQASVRAILARHEALRARFPMVEGRPVQVVDEPDDNWCLRVDDLTRAEGDRTAAALELLNDESTTPFDLAGGPLLRCMLVKMSDTEHLLGVTMHHIVSDTWSLGLFVRELSALYEAGGDLGKANLPPLPVQYRDYAVWQRERLLGETLERQVSHWRNHLAGAPPVLALPTAQRRTTTQRAEADRIESVLTLEETAALHAFCRARGVTPFMALIAGLATVFGRWAGQSEVVIGVPLAGRTTAGTDHMIGFFVNVLPFRIDLSGNPSFSDLMARVRRVSLDGYDHADAPLDVIVEDLRVARDPRRTPLFEVVLNVVGSPEAEQAMGLTVEPMETPSLFSRFDLTVTAQESAGRLRLQLDFASDRCDAAMVQVLVGHLHTFLRLATAEPERGILDYPFEPAGELVAPLEGPAPQAHRAVDRQAAALDRSESTTDGPAVIDSSGEWSYRWLSRASEEVALLLTRQGVEAGDPVAVVRGPSAGFVAAVLGCMKAGADHRVIEDAADAGEMRVVLDAGPDGGGTVDLTQALSRTPEPRPASAQDAQVEAVEQVEGEESADWAVERFGLTAQDRIAVLAGVPGHLESALSTAFHAGAAFVIPNCSFAGGADTLIDWLRTHEISLLYLTPSILRALAAEHSDAQLGALETVFVENAGDLISHDIGSLRTLSPDCRLVSVYRTAQDGRPRSVYEVPAGLSLGTAPLRVPLGTEQPHSPAVLMRANGLPASVGEPGELCFGSWRTGDIGRRWADGSLEFVGRSGAGPDFDPQETAATLRDIPGVRDAVVTEEPRPGTTPALIGYVAGPDPDTDAAVLHNFLRTRLPGYLLPERIVTVPAIPRTPWGEYDLAALATCGVDTGGDQEYMAPRTPMEEQLTCLIEELLSIERVGVHDSFFELGGFSLLATQLATRIRAMFHVEVALRDVFESPTVDELAQLIVREQAELSGDDDLAALLDEIDLADPDELLPAESVLPVAAEGSARYGQLVDRLRAEAVFTADKPDEAPETSARALWFAAAGAPRAVQAVADHPLPDLSPQQEVALGELLLRRIAGEPLAYLTGRGGFMGLEFLTEPGALIPRRGTELLGGAVRELVREMSGGSPVRLLDLCTGAGNLGVSLAVLEPLARVWASDLEAEAVAVAARNAEFHGVAERVTTATGDLFGAMDSLSPVPGPFDVVVCNPPYMPTETAQSMPVEMGGHEPEAAFDGGDIGLTVVYRLIAEAPRRLAPGGWLCFEVGAGMGRVVEKRMAALGTYSEIRLVTDKHGNTRAILARRL